MDYNLFTDVEALQKARQNGTDRHSVYGDPRFVDPVEGDYRVADGSPAKEIGFKNFAMESFGVKKPRLRKLAKTPKIPALLTVSSANNADTNTMNWLGGHFKNIETLAERSVSGLSKTAGVLLTAIDEKSVLAGSGLQTGDVIVEGEGQEISNIIDLMKIVQEHNWKGSLNLKVFRNQQSMDLTVRVKK